MLDLHGSSPALSKGKGFYLARQDIGPDKRFVVYAGQDQFSIGENITAIPLHQIMTKLLEYKRA